MEARTLFSEQQYFSKGTKYTREAIQQSDGSIFFCGRESGRRNHTHPAYFSVDEVEKILRQAKNQL